MNKIKQAPDETHIGYVSRTFGVPFEKFKTVQLKNATPEKLMELIAHNLNNLHMFRIISDVITFGSHEVNTLPCWNFTSSLMPHLRNQLNLRTPSKQPN